MRAAWIDHVARLLRYESIAVDPRVQPFVSKTVDSLVGECMKSVS